MADFELTGTVVRAADDRSNARLSLDLFYRVEVSFGPFASQRFTMASARGITRSDDRGAFAATVTIADDQLAVIDLMPRTIPRHVDLSVIPFVPAANRSGGTVRSNFTGTASAGLTAALRNARCTVNLDPEIVTPIAVTIALDGTVSELDGLSELSLDVLQQLAAAADDRVTAGGDAIEGDGTFCIGRGIARRDGSDYTGTVFCRRAELLAFPSWIVMHDRTPRPASKRALAQTSLGRIFVRTRAKTFAELIDLSSGSSGLAIETRMLLTRIDESVRQDDTQDELVDAGQIEHDLGFGLLTANIANVDFRDSERIKVTGRIGYGVQLFVPSPLPGQLPSLQTVQLFEIGSFAVTISVSRFVSRRLRPSRSVEFDRPLKLETVSTSFDLFPGTDLDELPGALGINDIENFIAGDVATRILERFSDKLADKVDDRIDDFFDGRDEIDTAADLQGLTRAELVAELRDEMFLQLDDVDIVNNDLTLRAFAGLWHPLTVADVENIDCAANAAAFMFPASKPMKAFRRYEMALSHESLAPWRKGYEAHRKELARIAMSDPSLSGSVVRLAADLVPILGEKTKVSLSADAVERLTNVVKVARAQASPKLAQFLDRAAEVFKDGEGKTFGELLKIAAQRTPG